MNDPADLTPDDVVERSQWDFFWVPADAVVVDRPDVAYVSCPRPSPFLNCVTRTRAMPDELHDLIEEVGEAHGHTTSRWLVRHRPETEALARALEAAGYAPAYEHRACLVEVDRFQPRAVSGITARVVSCREELLAVIRVAEAAFGSRTQFSPAEIDQYLEECTRPGGRVRRFLAYDESTGAPLSAGGMTLFPDLGFAYFWGGGTIPEARGRGAYSAVLAGRIEEARAAGLRSVGLYARIDSSAPVVRKQGFELHGTMSYWDRPAPRP